MRAPQRRCFAATHPADGRHLQCSHAAPKLHLQNGGYANVAVHKSRREDSMKYAVWFVRLVFGGWMVPAGLNHFLPLFPQPQGSGLSGEVFRALFDSHLFDMVKAVEFLAGVYVLTGFFTPLALVICMPVSFCVFWWDNPLSGWGSRANLFGQA